jgi:hypothetical protein
MYELTRNRYRPDYIAGVVTIAPQFPRAWPNASLSSADVDLQYFAAADVDPQQHFAATSTLRVALARPAPRLEVHVPVRAQSVAAVRVTGLPDGATFNYTLKPGFGQTVLVVTAASVAGGAELSAATVTVSVGTGYAARTAQRYSRGLLIDRALALPELDRFLTCRRALGFNVTAPPPLAQPPARALTHARAIAAGRDVCRSAARAGHGSAVAAAHGSLAVCLDGGEAGFHRSATRTSTSTSFRKSGRV